MTEHRFTIDAMRYRLKSKTGLLTLVSLFIVVVACVIMFLIPVSSLACMSDHHASPPSIEGYAIGIDLGTTYSCVAVASPGRDGAVTIIPNTEGNRITASYVSWNPETGEMMLGDVAKANAARFPNTTIFDIKRIIGRQFDDPVVQEERARMPYRIVPNTQNMPMVEVVVQGVVRQYSPEEISGLLLTYLKQTAEIHLGGKVEQAVVTVPAYFNDAQRQATREAAKLAGLNVFRIMNEPTTAGVAYGLHLANYGETPAVEKQVLVFDLGGGTFDVTLISVDMGVLEVLATGGDTHLGGEDFDQRLMDYVVKTMATRRPQGEQAETCPDDELSPHAMQELRHEVERAKRELSSQEEAWVRLANSSFLSLDDRGVRVTRRMFEDLNADLFQRTINSVHKVLKAADVRPDEVDQVVLVGGSTRIPKIRQLLRETFSGKEPIGALHPDEAVAFGAGVHAGWASGISETQATLLLDVTPISLGIETENGTMAMVVPRFTVIPTKKTKLFTTTRDGQTAVEIKVFEGEDTLTVSHNNLLGNFELSGIAPAPRGTPQIEVTFGIDVNGILSVSARDASSGKFNSLDVIREVNKLVRR